MPLQAHQDMITIHPSPDTLQQWARQMVPFRDIWYWDDEPFLANLNGCAVLSRGDYLAHPIYSGIEYVNAYWHWRMPTYVQHVLVADPEWIGSLASQDRDRVLVKQVELDRGLIVPRTHFDSVPDAMRPHIVNDKIIIGRAAWLSCDQADQFTALQREMLLWDDADCMPVPAGTPGHIQQIANVYGEVHGANCLSTTAFCVTRDESIRNEWMFQPAFMSVLQEHGFRPVDDQIVQPGDVITFASDGTVVHAAYCVAADLFVNKNGQSMFNPVRIVTRAMLDADWSDRNVAVYRQRPS